MNYEDTDHIVLDGSTNQYECKHCGTVQPPPQMPCPINIMIDAMDVFIAEHKDCPAPAQETVMSEYIKGFDAGYDYVLREIERWQEEVGQDLDVLLAHLRIQPKEVG
jgi:hypothetical protein